MRNNLISDERIQSDFNDPNNLNWKGSLLRETIMRSLFWNKKTPEFFDLLLSVIHGVKTESNSDKIKSFNVGKMKNFGRGGDYSCLQKIEKIKSNKEILWFNTNQDELDIFTMDKITKTSINMLSSKFRNLKPFTKLGNHHNSNLVYIGKFPMSKSDNFEYAYFFIFDKKHIAIAGDSLLLGW